MEQRSDLISSLPNEILHHIISKISFKQTIQISTLSTSWMSLMTPIRAKIDHNHFQTDKVNLIIQSFVKSRETLKLYLDSDEQLFAIVTKGSHGDLHLNFSNHKNLFPRKFSMILKQSTFFRPSFSSVTILHLRSVSDVVRNLVSDLFSSFRVLESLKIEKCDGLEDIEIRGNECLKNFEMVDCSDIVRVVLSARNLESFSYRGVFAIIQLMDVLNLVDFRLDLRDGLGDNNNAFDCEDVLSLLCSVKDVEVLRVSSWLLEALCSAGVIFNMLDFQLSKLKYLRCVCSKISTKTRDSVACFLNITPSLEELFVEIFCLGTLRGRLNGHRDPKPTHLKKEFDPAVEPLISLISLILSTIPSPR
ncbi:hypothetical protein DH2020_025961 [Rehmannia glutinosa]|uniref:F-box domain-containing protein n=1 Tax=Rehmannia glutinosa TaxID=99300 RepID=A0ABR0W2E9_REHGL